MDLDIAAKHRAIVALDHGIREIRPQRSAGPSSGNNLVRVPVPPTHTGPLQPGISPRQMQHALRPRRASVTALLAVVCVAVLATRFINLFEQRIPANRVHENRRASPEFRRPFS
jgi:hypothetical protein